jgi:hypothetical protein
MDDRTAVSIPAKPASLAISVIKWQQAIDMISFSGFAWVWWVPRNQSES